MTKAIKKLKPKEQEFVKVLVKKNDNNASKTVKEVYGITNDLYARVKGSELLTRPNISQAVEEEKESLKSALIKKGITPERIAEKIDVLLNATDDKGADYNAIDKGLKHATNIYGIKELEDQSKTNNTYNFLFSSDVRQEVKEIEDRIKAKLLQRNENS